MKAFIRSIVGCATLLLAGTALAATGGDLGSVAESVTNSLGPIAKLMAAASYVCGIGFTLAGLVKFKTHKDNPQQTPLSAAVVLLVVGITLVFLPSVISSAGQTIFSGGEQTNSTGSGIQ